LNPKPYRRNSRIRTQTSYRQLDIVGNEHTTKHGPLSFSNKRSLLFRKLLLIQALRKYSALTIVLVSVFLVATNNITTRYKDTLSFSNKAFSAKKASSTNSLFSLSTHNSIALLPHISHSGLLGKERDEEEMIAEAYAPLIETEPSSALAYLSAQSFVASAHAMEQDPEMNGGVKLYEVQEGDTMSSIAAQNNITVNTLYWANNIDDVNEIMPGDTLFILPVAGLKYIVKEGDEIDAIAKNYKTDRDQIIAFNELPANGQLTVGEELIIPGAEKDIPTPEPVIPDTLFAPRQYATSDGKSVENRHGKPNTFPYGYCTWYVAQQKYVPWRGNAGAWLYNAKSAGYATGSQPKKGAIVVTTDNTYYGHVALVTKVSSDSIVVKEMNYDGWGVVNTRTISIKDRKIRGYIY